MPDFPAHASPALTPISSPRPRSLRTFSDLDLHNDDHDDHDDHGDHDDHLLPHNHTHRTSNNHRRLLRSADVDSHPPPPSLLSPAITPPATPGTGTPAHTRPAHSVPIDTSTISYDHPHPALLETLPVVNCVVRARIPTTVNGQEMFLHLYTNDLDSKEHLAIVFGPHIRSRSLDRPREGETEMDRMIRGAYTGRLYPGRVSSRVDGAITGAVKAGTGSGQAQASPLQKILQRRSLDGRPSAPRELPQKDHHAATPVGAAEPLAEEEEEQEEADEDPFAHTPPLVRIHSECYTGETVWSARCDCGEQLDEAARLLALPIPSPTHPGTSTPNPGGVIIYLRQEGRGIGLSEKLKAYNLQDLGSDTVEANLLLRHPADARSYGLATAMLVDLGLGGERGIRLLTNNPEKVRAVEGPGREVRVRERVAMVPIAWKTGGREGVRGKEVENYLKTKIERMSHLLQMGQP